MSMYVQYLCHNEQPLEEVNTIFTTKSKCYNNLNNLIRQVQKKEMWSMKHLITHSSNDNDHWPR